MACAPSEDSDQPGHLPSLIRVFPVYSMDRLRTQSFWSESSLGAKAILLILSCCSSFYFSSGSQKGVKGVMTQSNPNPSPYYFFQECLCKLTMIPCWHNISEWGLRHPGKRSTCTPSVYYRKSIWPVSADQLMCINNCLADRVTKFHVSLYFYFYFGCKSENVICCGNEYWQYRHWYRMKKPRLSSDITFDI